MPRSCRASDRQAEPPGGRCAQARNAARCQLPALMSGPGGRRLVVRARVAPRSARTSRSTCSAMACISRIGCEDLPVATAGSAARHVDLRLDGARPAGHHQHAVAEEHRLVDAVGDEEHRLPGGGAQPRKLLLQGEPRHGVDRRERLVHQDDVGIGRPGAGHRDALAHAAGELVRVAVLEAGEARQVDQSRARSPRARPAARARSRAHGRCSAAPCARAGSPAPGTRRRARGPGPRTGLPSQWMVPSVGRMKPASALSSVVLPQPLGPTSVTNSPARMRRSTWPVACTGPSAVSKKCRKPETTILSAPALAASIAHSKGRATLAGRLRVMPGAGAQLASLPLHSASVFGSGGRSAKNCGCFCTTRLSTVSS